MNTLETLITYFEKFPGIGARQARRFAFHILRLPKEEVHQLASLITGLQESVSECESCHRFFSRNGGGSPLCSICSDQSRDYTKLMVVERDSDITAIERAGVYDGLYFVLGGTVPLLETEDAKRLRSGALKSTVETRQKEDLAEVILAFSINPDGENTARFVESLFKDISPLKISHLGRGLSTGSELEYADPETIKNALRNRF